MQFLTIKQRIKLRKLSLHPKFVFEGINVSKIVWEIHFCRQNKILKHRISKDKPLFCTVKPPPPPHGQGVFIKKADPSVCPVGGGGLLFWYPLINLFVYRNRRTSGKYKYVLLCLLRLYSMRSFRVTIDAYPCFTQNNTLVFW